MSSNHPLSDSLIEKIKASAKLHSHNMSELRIAKYIESPAKQFETLTGWDYQSRTYYQRMTILNEIADGQKQHSGTSLYNSNIHISALDAIEAETRMANSTLEAAE